MRGRDATRERTVYGTAGGTEMNLALWIVAGVLAVVMLVSSTKVFVPKERIAGMAGATRWVEDFRPGALKAIGVLELLAAVG
jgi:DoxX-like family